MGVDKGYGSGYKNTGMSKAAALKPGRLKKTAPAVAKAKVIKSIVSKSKGGGTAFDIGGRQYMETGVSPLKLAAAAKALLNSGKFRMAEAVESRLAARLEGKFQTGNVNDVRMRNQSTSVFPRIDSTKIRTAPNRILEMQGQKRAAKYTDMDKFNDYMSGYPTSKAQAKAYGRAASKEIARNAKTPKMSQQAAQDSYERVSDLIKFGKRKAK